MFVCLGAWQYQWQQCLDSTAVKTAACAARSVTETRLQVNPPDFAKYMNYVRGSHILSGNHQFSASHGSLVSQGDLKGENCLMLNQGPPERRLDSPAEIGKISRLKSASLFS